MSGTHVTLVGDCQATVIPAGDRVVLPAGGHYHVAQALGGSVTLRDSRGLYRVAASEAAALGQAWVEQLQAATPVPAVDTTQPFGEEQVWAVLRQCFDPEIPVNIVDLGLIYDLAMEPLADGRFAVAVKMTLTATGCGMGPTIAADARSRIEALPQVARAAVDIVWDPQWTPHMIAPEARQILGLG
jgi:probable FeS assembly SUF system protein SufT